MYKDLTKKAIVLAIAIGLVWLAVTCLLPISIPFLLGAGLALAAEPAVGLLNRKLRLPRAAAPARGGSLVFLLSAAALTLLLALVMRQLGRLTEILPQIGQAVAQGTSLLRDWLLALTRKLPEGIEAVASRFLENLFAGSGTFVEQAVLRVPQIATGLLSGLSEGMLVIVTGILSGYMISVRLPALRQWVRTHLPEDRRCRYLSAVKGLRRAIGGWAAAELKLAGVAFVLLAIGFLLLQIPNGLLWACLTTVVDAFPILGVGTVLVPWSIVCLLQGDVPRGIGLLGIYAVVWLVRSVLEPKLVGKGLGLDPLVTLVAIYAGFRLWGIFGMLLAPILALAVTQLVRRGQ